MYGGRPLAMPFYAIATVPLINKLSLSINQVRYTDDDTGVGKLSNLRTWWHGGMTSAS